MYKIIGGDKKEYGPVSAEELRRWIAEGRVNAQTQVLAEGSTEWKPLSGFPEFADAFPGFGIPGTPPPPPAIGIVPTFSAEILNRDYDLDIGACITRAWDLLKSNFGHIFGGVAIFVLIQIAFSVLGYIPILGALLSLGNVLITGPLIGGVYLFLLKNIRRQFTAIGEVFSGFQIAFLQLLLGYIVSALLTVVAAIPGGVLMGISIFMMVSRHEVSALYMFLSLVGFVIAFIPSIYLSVSWMFTVPLIIDKRLDFWPAMGASRKLVTRHWWTAFALLIIMGLINVAGLVACCVGLFVSLPLTFTALMYAYEDIFSAPAQQTT